MLLKIKLRDGREVSGRYDGKMLEERLGWAYTHPDVVLFELINDR